MVRMCFAGTQPGPSVRGLLSSVVWWTAIVAAGHSAPAYREPRPAACKRKRTPPAPSQLTGSAADMIDAANFEGLNNQMAEYDQLREQIIKRSRDIQKLSKQAIFSLHRSDDANAVKQLDQAQAIALELLPMVQANPTLRQGSYGNSLEEWAEAKIFRGA